jgi:4'-phosphopantetheinyl transferase
VDEVVEMNVVLSWMSTQSEASPSLIVRWAAPEDHAAVAGRKSARAASSSLLARALLRAVLVQETGREDWCVIAEPGGKPAVTGPSGEAGPAVSWSHGGGLVAVAMSATKLPLGVDIEPHRRRNIQAIASYAFGPAEQSLVETDGIPAFFRIWTLREAMGKATGEGLALAADGRDHIMGGPEIGTWRNDDWWLAHLTPEPGYSLAVALRGGDGLVLRRAELGV